MQIAASIANLAVTGRRSVHGTPGSGSARPPSAGPLPGSQGAALKILGFNQVLSSSGHRWSLTGAGADSGDPILGKIAGNFADALAEARGGGIGDANARHIAGYETIVANRSAFPPGEFYIHTDLGDGASITTLIPAAGATPVANVDTAAVTMPALPVPERPPGALVSVTQALAAYAEWAA